MKTVFRKYSFLLAMLIILALLATQIKWIVYSIRFQDKVFQKSVELALGETMSTLTADKPLCNKVKECLECDSVRLKTQLTTSGVWQKIHDAIEDELRSYDIDLEYEMYILENDSEELKTLEADSKGLYYSRCMGGIIGYSRYQLIVEFPSRTRFFFATAGYMFVGSVVLILFLILSLFYLARIYNRELRIAKHTKELLNNVSHEFKTPLSSIALASNMIRKKRYGTDDKKLGNYAELIFKENRKLQNLVESLLRLEAVERNEFDYNKESTSIEEVIQEAASTCEMLLEEKFGRIKYDFNSDGAQVFVDKLHFVNVFVNLLSNAIKYSKRHPNIDILTRVENENLVIQVKDNGIGIPAKFQKYIFDKYYRVPTGDVHDAKGFGIGLAYVKQIVEAHEGAIYVESTSDEGTVFCIQLPLKKS
ncbi:HAMP domain-containing sensor histidine kinase [Draconibacterium sp. IB214405]|uniref:sensor histidine kinase n=1 Tax=Draconibacterium sp. IB214405 TaxID=3097352 RepID=UPI002A0F5249|nr:HAMP domain-containing sensor histidine kinase [Draconibacterium sp. IB214405]MDX8338658.1 HAMP domain-containing sensor histidine kinase [Draconibacterium sp. IB214405]